MEYSRTWPDGRLDASLSTLAVAMKIESLSLKDFSGGLNDHDPASGLAQNECARLENYFTDNQSLLTKRAGEEILQNSVINPTVFVADGNTKLLLHMDDASASATIADTSGSSLDFTVSGNTGAQNDRVPGLLPVGAPLAQEFFKPTGADTVFFERFSSGSPQLNINGLGAVTFDAVVFVKAAFTGAPSNPTLGIEGTQSPVAEFVQPPNPGLRTDVYQSGAPIIATANGYPYITGRPLIFASEVKNGLTIHQDYDSTAGATSGPIYAKFTLATNGIAGTVTSINSLALPTGVFVQIRGRYDQSTGLMELFVQGRRNSYATPVGGGTVNNTDGDAAAIGGFTATNLLESRDQINYLLVSLYFPTDSMLSKWTTSYNETVNAYNYAVSTANVPGEIAYGLAKALNLNVLTKLTSLYNAYLAAYNTTTEAALIAAYATLGAAIDDFLTAQAAEVAAFPTVIAAMSWPAYEVAEPLAVASYVELSYVVASAEIIIDEVRISSVARTDFPFEEPRGMGFEFSKSDGTRQAVISAADKLWYTIGDGTYTQMKFFDGLVPAFSTVAYWDAIFRDDILYLANGVDPTLAWDGATLCAWMNPTVAPTLSLAASSGTITAGTRQVAYSYVYGDYETGLSPAATQENAGGFHINVDQIPPRHSNVTAVRIYEDKAGTPGTWYLARQITHTPGALMGISGAYTPGSSPSYTSDAGGLGPADGSLGTAAYPLAAASVATNVSPNPKYLLAEHDRAFVCGMEDERYTLRYSQLGAFDVFGVFSYANATSNQGNLIGLASYYGEVHCSKDGRATLILRGSNPQNWRVLETLHPNVGAIDHWSYVHRYPVDSDQYVLCFKGRDGFYAYAGQQIQCISEKIKGSVDRLASGNATRNEWAVTTTAQFRAQSAQLTAPNLPTANVQASRYETDGLRQVGGTAKIVDQLDYLGLWSYAAQLVSGNVIAVCKGQNPEEFYFSTDDATTLYWTGDNFQTVTAIATTLAASERIIEIVKQGSANTYFLITDSAGSGSSSGGGMVYSVADPTGSDEIGPAYATLTAALYYDLDVPVVMEAAIASGVTAAIGVISSTPIPAAAPNNIFLNHDQSVGVDAAPNGLWALNFRNTASISSVSTTVAYNNGGSAGTVQFNTPTLSAGFFGFFGSNIRPLVYLTRREFPHWRGGTFRPQAYWDTTAGGRLLFLASTAETAGNRSTYLRTLTSAGSLTNVYTAQNVSAFTCDGTNVWLATIQTAASPGWDTFIRRSALATLGTIAASGSAIAYSVVTRLACNANATAGLVANSKYINTGTQDFWTYLGRLLSVATSTLNASTLTSLTANGDSGTIFSEVAVQTVTPYRWYVATSRISATDSAAMYVVTSALAASVFKGSAYESPSADAAVNGIISNLLFMPSQDAGFPAVPTWADRLYWFASAAAASDARMLQLGVPGTWTVTGTLSSELHNLGVFSAFDNLESGFTQGGNSNGLLFEVRNASDAAALVAATYQQQVANQKILGFSPVQPYFQWRITFTWSYSVANPTTSPTVDFVNVGFFLGQANLPRTIGFQWEGRTFWACAEDGAEENNTVLVYQKNGSWTKFYGWRPKSMFRFRNQFVALEDYQLVRLLSGTTDAGALIVGKARTGAIMGFLDKLLSRVQANVLAFANSLFSSRDGYVKITPYQNSTAIDDGAWVIPIPNATDKEPVRVLGEPDDEFTYNWIRALSLEIGTSEDTEGDWVPQLGQAEEIQQIDLELELTGDSYDIVVQ